MNDDIGDVVRILKMEGSVRNKLIIISEEKTFIEDEIEERNETFKILESV